MYSGFSPLVNDYKSEGYPAGFAVWLLSFPTHLNTVSLFLDGLAISRAAPSRAHCAPLLCPSHRVHRLNTAFTLACVMQMGWTRNYHTYWLIGPLDLYAATVSTRGTSAIDSMHSLTHGMFSFISDTSILLCDLLRDRVGSQCYVMWVDVTMPAARHGRVGVEVRVSAAQLSSLPNAFLTCEHTVRFGGSCGCRSPAW